MSHVDPHDVFWGVTHTRVVQAMQCANTKLPATRVNRMQSEYKELREMGMTRLTKADRRVDIDIDKGLR